MNLLLDTHAVLWFITADEKLSSTSKTYIQDSSNTCFVSIASFWEISIKYSLKKLELKVGLDELFKIIIDSGFTVLPLEMSHLIHLTQLEFHHRDPFDRLIIAQAASENLSIITIDDAFKKYNVDIIWSKV